MAKENHSIHLPAPSMWPLLLALSFLVVAFGIVYTYWLSILGVLILLISVAGWVQENRVEEHHE